MQLFTDDIAAEYRDFAAHAEDSPTFAAWGYAVADDPEVCAWLGELPQIKRQANLVFAAARWHGVAAPGPYAGLRRALLGDDGTLLATIMGRATQTNEVGRLATLLPALALAAAGSPVALLEVGASAGLCLYPDRWGYRWRTDDGEVVLSPDLPLLDCRATGAVPLPTMPIEVAWRGGVDLNPLDVTDDDAMAWLTTLVWPEHDERRARLTRAIDDARREPPNLVRGNLFDALPNLLAEAAEHGPVVVFHSAVVVYLEEPDRRRFQSMMTSLVAEGACHWISNEGKQVLPEVTATGPAVPEDHPTFVMGLDGQAVAWTHGHGRSIRWLG